MLRAPGLAIAALAAVLPALAQPPSPPERFWASLDLGVGSVALASDRGKHDDTGFAFGVEGGLAIGRRVALGLRLSGWTVESYDLDDPSQGESVGQVLAVARVYPSTRLGLFVRGGAGWATLTDNDPWGFDGDGWGATLGVGWDVPVGRRVHVTPSINVTRGRFDDVDELSTPIRDREYEVYDLSVGLTYR